jgi:hypothetical protein
MDVSRLIPQRDDAADHRFDSAFLHDLSSYRQFDWLQLFDVSSGIRPKSFARLLRPANEQHFVFFDDKRPDPDAIIAPVNVTAFRASSSWRTVYVPRFHLAAARGTKFHFQRCHLLYSLLILTFKVILLSRQSSKRFAENLLRPSNRMRK